MSQSAGNIFKDLVIKLTGIYDSSEAKSISYMLLEELFDIPKSSIVLNKEVSLSEEQQVKLAEFTERLKGSEPIQHIVGRAYFYNRPFKVNTDVLVPRQETEEIISRIVKENKKDGLRLVDIGTGSGVIAITLAYELKNPEIHAWDVSKEALLIAKENAVAHKTRIHFKQLDILKEVKDENTFDVIVSNPPYVKESEKLRMKKNVLKFDPAIALFVPNDDPLKFHEAIAKLGMEKLNPGGRLYLEINERLGTETLDVINQAGYKKTKLIKDLNEKDRFVTGVKP